MAKYIDLTTEMYDGAPTMPMDPKLSITWHCNLDNLGYNLSRVTTSTHQGTHIDSSRHFFYDGETIDSIALDRVIKKAVKVDLTRKQPKEPITVEDLLPYEQAVNEGKAILLHTGWDKQWPETRFFSDFPYVTLELAQWFADHKTAMIGMDMPTPNGDAWKVVHEVILAAGTLIVEGLCNMEEITKDEFMFFALPLKLKGRDGSPIRAIAIEE